MRIYMDSSALVKRSIDEPESPALRSTLRGFHDADDTMLTSVLSTLEVSRSIRSRLEAEQPVVVVELIEDALAGVLEVPISEQVIGLARRLGPSSLRSLDAIHLASATLLDADVVCAYDARLLLTATELGFRTISPS